MQVYSKKFSILAIVLLVLSGIIGFVYQVLGAKTFAQNGRLVPSTGPKGNTCITEAQVALRNCHNTESDGINSATTVNILESSDPDDTPQNTTGADFSL